MNISSFLKMIFSFHDNFTPHLLIPFKKALKYGSYRLVDKYRICYTSICKIY